MDEILTQIMQLAMKVNAETEKAVFFEYYGHVNSFRLWIGKSKEDYNNEEYYQCCNFELDNAMSKLAEIKTVLDGLLKEAA